MSSTREARSARREALKTKLQSCNLGKVSKKPAKVVKPKKLEESVKRAVEETIHTKVEHNTEEKVEPQLNTTDDELEAYVQEFEQTSLGAVPPPSLIEIPTIPPQSKNTILDFSDILDLEDVPALDSLDSPQMPNSPTSPTSPQLNKEEENGIDEYITFANDQECDEPIDLTTEHKKLKSLYKFQPFPQTFHNSFNPNNRTLMAAWYTMAQDCLNGPREAYIHSVLLAAASLNQRSMLSGRARQTMSPGMVE